MADNICGSSNALNRLQKHSNIDRSQLNERLRSRNLLLQSLRSKRASRTKKIEEEFEAFQEGHLPPISEGFFQASALIPSSLQQVQPSSWAQDFQRLSVSNIPSLTGSYLPAEVSPIRGSNKDSRQHQLINKRCSPAERIDSIALISQNFRGISGHLSLQTEPWDLEHEQSVQEDFDAEAFARAFDEASRSEFTMDVDTDQQRDNHQNNLLSNYVVEGTVPEKATPSLTDDVYLSQTRIGADSIDNDNAAIANDSDALSKVASNLLNNLQHEQSFKFQNSQFLELMRQFRDREATIEKDQVVTIRKQTSLNS
ncbi:hypothetical protein K3495_g10253 [Podosphaera aphanis]|nr:hypothetical protein K3495_g10253 [Podosphaera aphanis]